jgi:hypothetical protein
MAENLRVPLRLPNQRKLRLSNVQGAPGTPVGSRSGSS